jgi:hypothetical protein
LGKMKEFRSKYYRRRLFGLLLKESDQVVPVLVLLETTESHLSTGNVLLGVLEVLELYIVSCFHVF